MYAFPISAIPVTCSARLIHPHLESLCEATQKHPQHINVDGQSIARQRLCEHVKTHAIIEVRVFIARCWATSSATMNSLRSAPRALLRNDSANTFQQ
jgi:hypothetical protein